MNSTNILDGDTSNIGYIISVTFIAYMSVVVFIFVLCCCKPCIKILCLCRYKGMDDDYYYCDCNCWKKKKKILQIINNDNPNKVISLEAVIIT